jgi:site-specific recombinase XerD
VARRPRSTPTLEELARSWRLSLEQENKSPRTITQYLTTLRLFDQYLDKTAKPDTVGDIDQEAVSEYLVAVMARGGAASTAATRYKAVRLFFAWCETEDEIATSPMAKMRPPIVPEQPVPVLTTEQVSRLLKACKGTGFEDRRDTAIVSLFIDTGIRRAELAALTVDDVDLDAKTAAVLGKGRRPRLVRFGARTGVARRSDTRPPPRPSWSGIRCSLLVAPAAQWLPPPPRPVLAPIRSARHPAEVIGVLGVKLGVLALPLQ